MRIGVIAPPWVPVPPPRYGGTESVVDTLAQALARAGHDVTLFATGDSTCPVPRESRYAEPPARMGTTVEEAGHVLDAYAALADCDVIHDHTILGPLWAGTTRDRPPVVTTNHGEFTPELRAVFGAAAAWAMVTAISRSQASTANGVDLSAVILHGVDPREYEVGTGSGQFALFLGRMSPKKGPDRAIDIARRAGVPLRMAAKMREPHEIEYFKRNVAPRLGSDVELLGEVSSRERVELLRDARVLINPILWDEPFGLVMIEAMACGTPVIAYRRGAAPEIVEPGVTGFLCEGIEDAAEAVAAWPTLSRDACRAAVETRFSASRMATEYVEVYRRAIENQQAGPAGGRVVELGGEPRPVTAAAR